MLDRRYRFGVLTHHAHFLLLKKSAGLAFLSVREFGELGADGFGVVRDRVGLRLPWIRRPSRNGDRAVLINSKIKALNQNILGVQFLRLRCCLLL